jgi:hypothetical protein
MQKSIDVLGLAVLIGIAAFFASTRSYAACAPALGTKCGDFGKNTITLLSTSVGPCPSGVPSCTKYTYEYRGSNTNQIELLIPKTVQTKFVTSAAAAGCSALITDGSGDPANSFGVNIVTHNLCKLTANISDLSTFDIFADPSTAKPLSWQEIVNKSVTADTLDGPGIPGDTVAETAATLTTSEGVSVQYTNVGGQITITGGSGRVVPVTNTKLCILKVGGTPVSLTSNPVAFANNWTCETITFATEQCDIKTAGSDPCRFIGGSCVVYP